jgi:hypothetical protein
MGDPPQGYHPTHDIQSVPIYWRARRWDRARILDLLIRYMPFVVLAFAALIVTWHIQTYW